MVSQRLKLWNAGFFMAGDVTKKLDLYVLFEMAVGSWTRSYAATGSDYEDLDEPRPLGSDFYLLSVHAVVQFFGWFKNGEEQPAPVWPDEDSNAMVS